MRLILLISSFLYLAYGQGNGIGNGNGNGNNRNGNNGNGVGNGDDPEFELPTSVISLPESSISSVTSTISSSSTSFSLPESSSTSVPPTTTTSSTSQITTSTTSTTFTQPPIIAPTAQPNNSRSGGNVSTGLIIGGIVVGAIVLLGIMVFIYRKIRGLDDEDFKIDRNSPKPFSHDRLSAPDYGRSAPYGSQQYAVYPTVGRPGLPGFVEKGQIVETPNTMDTNYYGTPEFGFQPDYYNQYPADRTTQYSNGYQVTRPQDSMHVGRQY